eukprot:scaffold912_cov119-Cylindrotheca_fusiformis.AAC.16
MPDWHLEESIGSRGDCRNLSTLNALDHIDEITTTAPIWSLEIRPEVHLRLYGTPKRPIQLQEYP